MIEAAESVQSKVGRPVKACIWRLAGGGRIKSEIVQDFCFEKEKVLLLFSGSFPSRCKLKPLRYEFVQPVLFTKLAKSHFT